MLVTILLGVIAVLYILGGVVMRDSTLPWVEEVVGYELSFWERAKILSLWPVVAAWSLFITEEELNDE